MDWPDPTRIPDDDPYWSDLFQNGLRAGAAAARATLVPALIVWSMMGLLAIAYYSVPASQPVFVALTDLQRRMGLLFPFLGMGLAVGLLTETIKVITARPRRWRWENTINATFNLLVFGVLGVLQNYFYILQGRLFGTGNTLSVLVPKVLVDQFVWTVFFANPYQTVLYLWRNLDFSFDRVWRQVRPVKLFWGRRVLPVLVTNWAFWIPMVSIVYSFPGDLQLPLAILAVTIWVFLLTYLTAKDDDHA